MGEARALSRTPGIVAVVATLVACRQGSSASSLAADARVTAAIVGADAGTPLLDDSVPRFEPRPDPHGGVVSIAFSPDATALAVASSGGPMTVWDLARGAVRFSVASGWNDGHGLAWSPDGTRIAAVDRSQILVFDAASGQRLASIEALGDIRAIVFSRDGTEISSVSAMGSIGAWNAATGTMARLASHELHHGVSRAVFGVDGGPVAMALDNGDVSVVGVVGHAIHVADEAPGAIAWGPGAGRIAAVRDRGTSVELWEVRSGMAAGKLSTQSPIGTFAFSPDGRSIAVASEDGSVDVLAVPSGSRVHRLSWHNSPVRAVAWSTDGTAIASGGDGGYVLLWDARTGAVRTILPGPQRRPVALACSPDGASLAVLEDDLPHHVWNLRDGTVRVLPPFPSTPPLRGRGLPALGYARMGEEIVGVGVTGSVTHFDAQTLVTLGTVQLEGWPESAERWEDVSFDAAGKLVTARYGWDFRVWDLGTREPKRVRGTPPASAFQSAPERSELSPDGRLLAVQTGTSVALLDVDSGAQHATVSLKLSHAANGGDEVRTWVRWTAPQTLSTITEFPTPWGIDQWGFGRVEETWNARTAERFASVSTGQSRLDRRVTEDARQMQLVELGLGPPGRGECADPRGHWVAYGMDGGILIQPVGKGTPVALHLVAVGAALQPVVVAADGRFDAAPEALGALRFRYQGHVVPAEQVASFRRPGLLAERFGPGHAADE